MAQEATSTDNSLYHTPRALEIWRRNALNRFKKQKKGKCNVSVLLANHLPPVGLPAAPPPRRVDVTLRGESSTVIEIIQAQEHVHAPRIRELFWEYLQWASVKLNEEFDVNLDIAAMLEQDMVELGKFLPPSGRLLLGRCDGQVAGIACLRRLSKDIGEVKRMYVRSTIRRRGVGRTLFSRLLDEARAIGYQRMRLDSARFMKEAHALYRSFGFREIEPYAGSEIPQEFQAHWIFMERDVDGG